MHSVEVNRAAIGLVRKPHGIRGGLKVTLYSIDLDRLQNMEQLFVNTGNNWRTLTLKSAQGYDDFSILHFQEISNRSEADEYRDLEIFAPRELLPELDDDEFYIDDLVGCEVLNEKQEIVGKISEILTPGAHEVLVVQNGEEELLVPLVDEWVTEIDIPARQVWINSPEETT